MTSTNSDGASASSNASDPFFVLAISIDGEPRTLGPFEDRMSATAACYEPDVSEETFFLLQSSASSLRCETLTDQVLSDEYSVVYSERHFSRQASPITIAFEEGRLKMVTFELDGDEILLSHSLLKAIESRLQQQLVMVRMSERTGLAWPMSMAAGMVPAQAKKQGIKQTFEPIEDLLASAGQSSGGA